MQSAKTMACYGVLATLAARGHQIARLPGHP